MNVSAKFDEIPSMTLQYIMETKRHGHTSFGGTDGQHENSIPSHRHSLRGYKHITIFTLNCHFHTIYRNIAAVKILIQRVNMMAY